jgi:hypothetical protein
LATKEDWWFGMKGEGISKEYTETMGSPEILDCRSIKETKDYNVGC